MTDTIPVIDVADYLAGRPGALQATARALHDALTTVGFLVLTGHDVPQAFIAQTFAEAKRLHDLPMASKWHCGSMNITTATWRWVAMPCGLPTSTRTTRAT